jgi:hypothetical protein
MRKEHKIMMNQQLIGKKRWMGLAMILAAVSLSLPLSLVGNASAAVASYAFDADSNFRILLSGATTVGDNAASLSDDFQTTFSAPDVNPAAAAVLLLRVRGVNCSGNTIKINGVAVSNALTPRDADEVDDFYSEIGIIPANVLKATGNTLQINSVACTVAGDPGNRDDFTVDNVVLLYKQP